MTRLFRLIAAAALLALSTLAFVGTASAQQGPPPTTGACNVQLPPQANPRAQVAIDSNCFAPGRQVTVTVNGEVLGSGVVGPDGVLSLDITAPSACGTYPVVLSDGETTVTSQLVVTGCGGGSAPATSTQSAGTLPYTGNGSSVPMAQIGVALLAAGALTTLVVRKRQVADQA